MVVEEYIEEPEESGVQSYQAIDPDPPYEEAPDETWSQLGIVAGAVLVLAGVLFFVRKKFSKGQLPTPIQEVRLHNYNQLAWKTSLLPRQKGYQGFLQLQQCHRSRSFNCQTCL